MPGGVRRVRTAMTAPSPRPDRARLVNLAGAVSLDLVTAVNTAVATQTGLDAVATTALTALANVADGLSIDVLRGLVGLSQPGCARLVDRLGAAGLVQRERAAGDRRVVTVQLTALGRATTTTVVGTRAQVLTERLRGLTDDRALALEQLLAELAAGAIIDPADADPFCRSCDPDACRRTDPCPTTERAHELIRGAPLRNSMRDA